MSAEELFDDPDFIKKDPEAIHREFQYNMKKKD